MLTRTPRGSSNKNHLLARGITLWRCIADDFEQMILVGKHDNGERLPAESEIAARGLVRTERGSGTYVKTDKLDYRIGQRTRFSEVVAAAGHEAEGRLQGHRLEPASDDIANRLGLKAGDVVVRLEIVRASDRVPISVATTWLSAERFHDAAKIFRQLRSITRTLDHYGISGYRRKWTRISAAFTDAVDAGRLRLSIHRPILVVESLDVTSGDAPILTTRGRFAADRVALIVES